MVEKKKYYLTNKELLLSIAESKKLGRMTDTLANQLMLLVARYAKRPNWIGYSWNTDMQASALVNLCRVWASFNETKSSNPFAYYSQIIGNVFIQYLKHEKKARKAVDALLIDQGMNPSYGAQLEHEQASYDRMRDNAFESDSELIHVYPVTVVAPDTDYVVEQIDDVETDSESTEDASSENSDA